MQVARSHKLCLNVKKSNCMLFHMPQRVTPLLHFELNGSPIDYIQEFNFLGLTLDSSLSFKFHLTKIGNKISRVIDFLHKLNHIFSSYILRMIYNSLILPYMNYSLFAWGANCHSIELQQEKQFELYISNLLSLTQNQYLKAWIS